MLVVFISVLWIAATGWLIYEKVYLVEKARDRVDYSVLFNRERFNDFSYMGIYLEEKYLGHSKSSLRETEGGGKLITGETVLSVQSPIVSGTFKMESRMYISSEQKLDRFTIDVYLPFRNFDEVSVVGQADGDTLNIDIPSFDIKESVDLDQAMISSGISPFADVVSITPGRSWQVGMFDPMTRTVKTISVTVVDEEVLSWHDQEETVYRLEARDENGSLTATAWVDRYGKVLVQTVTLFGLQLELRAYD